MPGRNCSLPGCTVSDIDKHKDIGMFKIPTKTDAFYSSWRKELSDLLAKYRPMDNFLKKRIAAGNVYFCEKHF